MSKGSKSRVSDLNRYRENYDRIFRKSKSNGGFSPGIINSISGKTTSNTQEEIIPEEQEKMISIISEVMKKELSLVDQQESDLVQFVDNARVPRQQSIKEFFEKHPEETNRIFEKYKDAVKELQEDPLKIDPIKKFQEMFVSQVFGMKKINFTDQEAAEILRHQKKECKIEINPQSIEEDERTEFDDECGV